MNAHRILLALASLCPACALAQQLTYTGVAPLTAAFERRYLDDNLLRALDRQDSLFEQTRGRPAMIAMVKDRFATDRRPTNNFIAPYFAMVQQGRHAGLSIELGQYSRMRLGVVSEGYIHAEVLPSVSPFAKRALASAEYEHKKGALAAIFTIGALRESGSRMTNVAGNPLALYGSARTTFSAISLAYALSPKLSLVGMASAGRTSGFLNGDEDGAQVSAVETASYSVGLSARRLWDDTDRMALTLTVPTKVTEGAVGLAGATLQRDDGTLSYSSRMLNLAPNATERDLELTYSRHLSKKSRVSGAMMLRINPGHAAGTAQEFLIGVRYGRKF